jgi:transcription elongation factor Elf1
VYYQLTDQGYRVFFARITLEDVVGKQYEPYIFAALNSAKVMIAIGTKPEYMNAVWVKNEWSRFLAMMKKDRHKILLPCYRDMDPYDMPEQLSVLQSYDMSKIGFIQDLIRGIKKVLEAEKKLEPQLDTTIPVFSHLQEISPLLKRIELFLEDSEFDRADDFCEKVLNIDPENASAYLGKLLIEFQCKTKEELSTVNESISNSKNYSKILRFGTAEEVQSVEKINKTIQDRLAERKRKEAEQRKQAMEVDATYYDVNCPSCGAELSYAEWQVDCDSKVVCPMCEHTFAIDLGKRTVRVDRTKAVLTCPVCGKEQPSNRTRCWECGVFFI